jgi:ferric-dicitrate binding protein FerR (iron transport regulator)
MPTHRSELNEMARRWAIRVGDPAFADWDALTGWLEADPAHLAAYQAVVDGEDWAAAALARTPKP